MRMTRIALAMVAVAVAISSAAAQPEVEPAAGTWRPWVLASGSAARVASPPDARETAGELTWLNTLIARRCRMCLCSARNTVLMPPAPRCRNNL